MSENDDNSVRKDSRNFLWKKLDSLNTKQAAIFGVIFMLVVLLYGIWTMLRVLSVDMVGF